MQTNFDIAICGAGPVGQTLALLLIRRGIKKSGIVLIDAKTDREVSQDRRTIALSSGSRQILETAGAWPVKATAIRQIHISRAGHFGRSLIDAGQHQVNALGYVARYTDILAPLSEALRLQGPGLTFLRPATVSNITQTPTRAGIELENGQKLQAQIVVQAEGGLFGEQVAQTRHHDYRQSAIIATVQVSAPITARAFERFTDQGPLALLPGDDGYALVWCVAPELATQLLAMDDAQFLQKLQNAFGERLGKFTGISPRAAFALGLNAQTGAPDQRVIRIGNAAQTLHPVAGQGLNLGLRDALALAKSLSISQTPAALQDFYQARKADRNTTIGLTDTMAQIFTRPDNGSHALQAMLGAGLGLIDIVTPAKQWLATQMMFGTRE